MFMVITPATIDSCLDDPPLFHGTTGVYLHFPIFQSKHVADYMCMYVSISDIQFYCSCRFRIEEYVIKAPTVSTAFTMMTSQGKHRWRIDGPHASQFCQSSQHMTQNVMGSTGFFSWIRLNL